MKYLLLSTLVLSVLVLSQPVEARKKTADERLARLERLLDSKSLVQMLSKLEQLQSEISILRGEVEMQTHTLKNIKKRQRDLYVDIDRRLLKLERSGGVSSAPITPAVPSSTNTASKPKTSKPKHNIVQEQKAYQMAFDLLRNLRYDKSITSFRDFLKQYPDGRYAHIAQYWIGEANYAQRKFKNAITDYQVLIKRYPASPKLAEAMLKISYSYYEMKDLNKADINLQRLIRTYPDSTEAGQARNLLQKVRLQLKKNS
ncbi:MAG: tol-pal system protein YbgF [Gammaproteobacteria bacterium]|nr:tol-pal system protein YbgF [Gammaproteobacteria bacterium]